MSVERRPQVVVRPAEPADLTRCAEIFLSGRLQAKPDDEAGIFRLDDFADEVADQDLWVAVADGRVVGLVSADIPAGLIRNVFVDPAWQKRGVGYRLLSHVCARLRPPIRLICAARNHAARAFYEHVGWREVTPGVVRDGHVLYQHMSAAACDELERPPAA